jgi:hypothetical protein
MPFIRCFRTLAITCALAPTLAACSTTQQAMQIASAYYGLPVDGFFRMYGMPVDAYEFDDGSRVYRWSSGRQSVYMPAITSYSGSVNSFGMVSGTSSTVGGVSLESECLLDLYTDKDKKIVEIKPLRDVGGIFLSICYKVLR